MVGIAFDYSVFSSIRIGMRLTSPRFSYRGARILHLTWEAVTCTTQCLSSEPEPASRYHDFMRKENKSCTRLHYTFRRRPSKLWFYWVSCNSQLWIWFSLTFTLIPLTCFIYLFFSYIPFIIYNLLVFIFKINYKIYSFISTQAKIIININSKNIT